MLSRDFMDQCICNCAEDQNPHSMLWMHAVEILCQSLNIHTFSEEVFMSTICNKLTKYLCVQYSTEIVHNISVCDIYEHLGKKL